MGVLYYIVKKEVALTFKVAFILPLH